MAFEVEETGPGLQVPDFDEVVHGAGDAAGAGVVEDDGVDFLRVALKSMDEIAVRDFPDADGAVVGAGDEGVAVGGDGADGSCGGRRGCGGSRGSRGRWREGRRGRLSDRRVGAASRHGEWSRGSR